MGLFALKNRIRIKGNLNIPSYYSGVHLQVNMGVRNSGWRQALEKAHRLRTRATCKSKGPLDWLDLLLMPVGTSFRRVSIAYLPVRLALHNLQPLGHIAPSVPYCLLSFSFSKSGAILDIVGGLALKKSLGEQRSNKPGEPFSSSREPVRCSLGRRCNSNIDGCSSLRAEI